jgi:hypothetical protein
MARIGPILRRSTNAPRSDCCARAKRPGGGCTAEQRDEPAPFQLIEPHFGPSQGRIAEYRIGGGQSGGIRAFGTPLQFRGRGLESFDTFSCRSSARHDANTRENKFAACTALLRATF